MARVLKAATASAVGEYSGLGDVRGGVCAGRDARSRGGRAVASAPGSAALCPRVTTSLSAPGGEGTRLRGSKAGPEANAVNGRGTVRLCLPRPVRDGGETRGRTSPVKTQAEALGSASILLRTLEEGHQFSEEGSQCLLHFSGLFHRLQTPVPTVRTFSMSLSSHQVAGPVWNLGRLNHVAVAVPDLEKAKAFYKNVLGAQVGETVPLPEHGVSVVFVNLGNTKMELLHPLGNDSPIAGFLQKNKAGGMHHICIEATYCHCHQKLPLSSFREMSGSNYTKATEVGQKRFESLL
eukprot:bmy_11613T0